MSHDPMLRPIERRILRLVDEGVSEAEIARRFRRSPETIQRVIALAGLHRQHDGRIPQGDVLRPIERRVLRWRALGIDYADIGPRFRRSPAFIQRVEGFAHYKLGRF